MKTNENAKNIIIVIGSLVIATFTGILAYLVGKEIGQWGLQTIQVFVKWINKIFNKNKLEALKPLLKEAIKKADHVSLDEIEKSTTREVVDIDQVPERIREKIESYEEAQKASGTKTIINGKISSKADQFIYDCKQIKRDRIGSHKVIVGDKNIAKKIKAELTKSENEFVKFYKDMGHDPDRLSCLNFMDGYFTWVNEYIDLFDCYCDKVSFEETDAIINKYFGE